MKNKFYLEASIKLVDETPELKEEASKKLEEMASIIKLPDEKDRQPDLQYMSAILVSSGTNLNGAHFLTSELLKAKGTIASKALDVEHVEDEIIGHLYDQAFVSQDNNKKLEIAELASMDVASLDKKDVHVATAAVIYKDRFPKIAEEVANNEWKVSMECYYSHYDVKIGDMILSADECEFLGLASEDASVFGKEGKVIKDGKEIASGKVTRVLRGICFSGCGIVKNPANPPSIIIEAADTNDHVVLNYDYVQNEAANNVTSKDVESEMPDFVEEVAGDANDLTEEDVVSIATEHINNMCKCDELSALTDRLNELINKAIKML